MKRSQPARRQGALRHVRALTQRSLSKVVTIAVLALALAAVGIFTLAARQAPNADELAIRQVCHAALVAEQTLAVPPAAYQGGKMPAAIQDQMRQHIVAELQKYYSGEVLASKIGVIQHYVETHQDGTIRYLGGGVKSLVFSQIAINGDNATVTAEAVEWAKMAQVQPGGKVVPATPQNTVEYTFTLVKTNGQWYITGEDSQFAPGSEP